MVEIAVNCALCSDSLEAGVIEGEIFVRPCPRCQRTRVEKIFVELDPVDPATVERYALKEHHVRGRYIGRSKTGNFVRFGTLKKMHKYVQALVVDYNNMMSSPSARFRRCGLCGVMTTDGWVCTHCGGDDTAEE